MPFQTWLAERIPLDFLRRFAKEQMNEPQPRHVSWLHTFGFTVLLLLIVQIATGILLLFYYKPGALTAYNSVKFITEKVTLGWLFRQLHVWGAHFIVSFIFLHLMRVFFYGAYKKPRELTWMTGIGLFLIIMGFSLTGYLLPWDELAFWGTVVATDSTKEVPLLGDFLLRLVRGGEIVSDLTLTRFFAAHVALLPTLLLALIAGHLFLIRYHHISPLARTDEPEPTTAQIFARGGKPYFPDHFKKELVIAYLVLAAIVVLAFITKPTLGKPANPLVTPPGIKPEWYFLPVYQSLKYVPAWLGVLGNGAFVLLLLLLPLLDLNPERHPRRRKVAVWLGILTIAGGLGLGVLGHLADTTREIFGKKIYFDLKGIPSAAADKTEKQP